MKHLSEAEKRARRCCFTGHRPEKLSVQDDVVQKKLGEAIDIAISQGFRTFICGMARGVDLWAGKEVLLRKQCNPEIKLVCATPFVGFENNWDIKWRNLYAVVTSEADYKYAICQTYTRYCFQKRNEWMVLHSGLVIAAYNGAAGGTRNTVLFAKKYKIPVYNILGELNNKNQIDK